jgi:protein tyrosine phosphatase (PTP) superfamily phosphohydrolase (DUF442 family)
MSSSKPTLRRTRFLAVALAALLLPALALAQSPPATATAAAVQTPAPPATPLVNQREPLPGIRTGGIPKTPEGLRALVDTGFRALADAGFRTFVDLRGDAEVQPEVRTAAESAGLVYERIPIAGDADLDLATARRLHALLEDPAKLPVVVACASGNRAGALLAVEDFWLRGARAEQALELGQAAGLTHLEPSVRLLLGLPPLPPPPAEPAAPAVTPAH